MLQEEIDIIKIMSSVTILNNYIALSERQFLYTSNPLNVELTSLTRWMYEKVKMNDCTYDVYNLAHLILVRYLNFNRNVNRSQLDSYALASIMLADLSVSNNVKINVVDFAYVSPNHNIASITMEIVEALSGDLIIPTSIVFLNLISSIDAGITCQEKLVIKKILCKITFDNTALIYKQHDLAVAATMLVRGDPTFSLMNGRFKYTDYLECMRHVYDIMVVHSLFNSSMSTVKQFRYSPSTKPRVAVRSVRYVKQYNQIELSNLQFVNQGSFGQVYRAITGNNETVALKVQKGSSSYQSMLLDTMLLSSLKDNNIENIKSIYLDHEQMSFSMPYRNLDLYRLIMLNLSSCHWSDVYSNMSARPHNKIDYSIRRSIMIGILRGISYIHSMGVIHRDIKPGNILIDNSLNPKITDFGLSKLYVLGPDNHISGRYGNDAYSPPDRFLSQASDMWAVGVCLLELEMCTFATEFQTLKDLRDAHKIMISKNALKMVKDLPARRLLLQLLDYDPNRRISSQQALVSFN